MILWRYILRAHIGPFIFANVTIIFLFLLQFLMKTAADLVGKGLSPWVIAELVALNLAWILVLSVPMSVLVATLMAFGGLSSTNEIVIMRASGMSLYRMIFPVMIATILLTIGLIKFNNDILPETNIRLRTLMGDVLRIKPTLSLRAGVFSSEEELPNSRILVRKTFEENNNLEGVTLYDLTRPDKSVVVTAKQGVVSFTKDYTRLIMDLEDGEIHETSNSNFIPYRKLNFKRHRVTMSAEGFGFSRSDAKYAQRDDRTMSARAMRELVDSIAKNQQRKIDVLPSRLKEFSDRLNANGFFPRRDFENEMQIDQDRMLRDERFLRRRGMPPPERFVSASKETSATTISRDVAIARVIERVKQAQSQVASEMETIASDEKMMNKYLVEIYKKYSIPFACIVFVLIGVPLGIMARKGGFGIGAGLRLGFFLLYWACLIGGEKLADRDIASPFIGMWIANILLGVIGIFLTIRSARETLVIQWSSIARFIPRRWRIDTTPHAANPYEA